MLFDRLPLTARRYEHGRPLGTAEEWDQLRDTDLAFGVPERDQWIAAIEEHEPFRRRAEDIAKIVVPLAPTVVASYGAGTCTIEWHLARLLDARLVCADYAPRTVKKMRRVFPEAEHVVHDLTSDPPLAADVHLLHRVDPEFDDPTLRAILGRFDGPVLLVAAEQPLTFRRLFEYRRCRRRGAPAVAWARTTAGLVRLWGRSHIEHTVGDHRAFLLLDQ